MSSRQALKKAEWLRPNNRQAGRKKKEEERDVARSGARIARAAQPTAELILNRDAALPQIARTSMPDLLTVPEVGAYLRLKTRAIYELVRTDRIPSCKVSGYPVEVEGADKS
jgi:hypothetical protein